MISKDLIKLMLKFSFLVGKIVSDFSCLFQCFMINNTLLILIFLMIT